MLVTILTGLGALIAGVGMLWLADRLVPPDWPLRDLVVVALAAGAFVLVGGL